jgi:hypothetical protein
MILREFEVHAEAGGPWGAGRVLYERVWAYGPAKAVQIALRAWVPPGTKLSCVDDSRAVTRWFWDGECVLLE